MFHFRPLHPLIDFMTTMFEYYLLYLMYYFERIRRSNMSKKVRVPKWRSVVVNDHRCEVFSCSTSQLWNWTVCTDTDIRKVSETH